MFGELGNKVVRAWQRAARDLRIEAPRAADFLSVCVIHMAVDRDHPRMVVSFEPDGRPEEAVARCYSRDTITELCEADIVTDLKQWARDSTRHRRGGDDPQTEFTSFSRERVAR